MKNFIVILSLLTLLGFTVVSQAEIVYMHNDALGSPIMETNEQGAVISRSHYKPFGETMEAMEEGVGYTGHLNDTDLGLTYMQARYYDPVIGRFYSNDPLGFRDVHSFNRYAYANNNPYRYTDPDGQNPVKVATLVADVADLSADLATGNYAGAAMTAVGMIDPTGIVSIARRSVRAGKVYRALSKGENPANGLTARNPAASATPAQHVNGKKDSQFISTSKDKSTATDKYNSGNGVVEIDLSKVGGNVTDLSGGVPGGSQKVNNFAKKDQEVLIEGTIPKEAIKVIK